MNLWPGILNVLQNLEDMGFVSKAAYVPREQVKRAGSLGPSVSKLETLRGLFCSFGVKIELVWRTPRTFARIAACGVFSGARD